MNDLLGMQVGRFHAASLLIVLGLVAADVLWTLRVHRHLLSQKTERPTGYTLGLALGVWFRSALVAIAGLVSLFGSLFAFVLFAAGVVWRAMGPGREAVAGFLAGYEESTGTLNPVLASAFGAGWVAITRGIPLLLLYSFMRAA